MFSLGSDELGLKLGLLAFVKGLRVNGLNSCVVFLFLEHLLHAEEGLTLPNIFL